MRVDSTRLRRGGAPLVLLLVLAAVTAGPSLPPAAAEPAAPSAPSPEPEPWCHRDQDLACTLVRETPAGVWVWTERFRSLEAGSGGWTLSVGAGPVSSIPVVPHFVAAVPPPVHPTPNGAPILE